jgi:hypothetical protein
LVGLLVQEAVRFTATADPLAIVVVDAPRVHVGTEATADTVTVAETGPLVPSGLVAVTE